MQEKEITNTHHFSDVSSAPDSGRILSLDLGTKKIGAAASDPSQTAIKALSVIKRQSWKELLSRIKSLIEELDAKALVLGLPVNLDGSENEMSLEARRLARNFSLSLQIPVFLQDERLTTLSAEHSLKKLGLRGKDLLKKLDSEAAVIILEDFLDLKKSEKARMSLPSAPDPSD